MATRGVLYVYWGDKHQYYLDRSAASVRKYHPELPIHFEKLPPNSTLLDKARMYGLSPFDETLYLDIDTVVLGNLDFAFEKSARFGAACSICECPWGRRYRTLGGDIVEYNTGVLFFTRKAKPLFDAWARCVTAFDSSSAHVHNGQVVEIKLNDQAGFAKAVEDTGFLPYVLPYNWNFRPRYHHSFFGPIRIWHDYADVPKQILELNEYYTRDGAVIQFVSLFAREPAWVGP